MPNYERRIYEPSDEVRVFDGSEEEDDVEGSRLPLLIVLALLVLAMFAGVVWLAYRQGVARGRGETPVLTAAAGPERVAPQGAAGGGVPYQGFKIYEQPAPQDDGADAPAPAAPAAKPEAVAPAPPPVKAAEAPKPAPVAAAPAAKVAAPPPVAAKPAPTPAPVKAAAAPAAKTPAPAARSVASLIQQAETAKSAPAMKQAVIPPAAKPAPTVTTGALGPATGAPRALGTPVTGAPVASAPLPAATPAKPAPGGAYVLQIGAYKSQADANTAWAAYKARHAALLSGYSSDVKQVELGEKGTWYRLRVAGFSDREVASALCDRLKSDGGACILSR